MRSPTNSRTTRCIKKSQKKKVMNKSIILYERYSIGKTINFDSALYKELLSFGFSIK